MFRVHQSFSSNSGKKDFLEFAGDACLYLGRIAFGYRKISLVETPQVKKIKHSVAHILLFLVTLPLSSLIALSGLALITFSNTHQKKCRSQRVTDVSSSIRPSPSAASTSTQSPDPSIPVEKKQPEDLKSDVSVSVTPTDEKRKSQAFLQELSQEYRRKYGERKGRNNLWDTILDTIRAEEKPGIISVVHPNYNVMSNLILECQEEGEAYFLPEEIDPSDPKEFGLLRDTLQAAFRAEKKIVVTLLKNKSHCVAAAFSSKGKFQIIDSMLSHTIDKNALEKKLNDAAINNHKENKVQFRGLYINTHIQKGGHECIRFATLYCYHIFKRKEMDAFKEVNGAFVEGKLNRFEDYKKINGSKKISDLSSHGKDLYADFMRSWAYRTRGVELDSWKEINVESLQIIEEEDCAMYAIELKNGINEPPQYTRGEFNLIFVDAKGNETIAKSLVQMPKEQEVSLPEELLSCSLGSLTSTTERRFLIFEKNQQKPRLYRILQGQKLLVKSSSGERVL